MYRTIGIVENYDIVDSRSIEVVWVKISECLFKLVNLNKKTEI